MEQDTQTKPRFLSLVAWSWIALGLMGSLMSLLSIPSYFQLLTLKDQFLTGSFATFPIIQDSMLKLIGVFIPVTVVQLLVSSLMAIAGWKFLEGRNWARWILSGLNLILGVVLIGGNWLMYRIFHRISGEFELPLLVENGVLPNYPLVVTWTLIGLTLLIVIPMVWMGLFFHSKPVVDYCKN